MECSGCKVYCISAYKNAYIEIGQNLELTRCMLTTTYKVSTYRYIHSSMHAHFSAEALPLYIQVLTQALHALHVPTEVHTYPYLHVPTHIHTT